MVRRPPARGPCPYCMQPVALTKDGMPFPMHRWSAKCKRNAAAQSEAWVRAQRGKDSHGADR